MSDVKPTLVISGPPVAGTNATITKRSCPATCDLCVDDSCAWTTDGAGEHPGPHQCQYHAEEARVTARFSSAEGPGAFYALPPGAPEWDRAVRVTGEPAFEQAWRARVAPGCTDPLVFIPHRH